MCIFYIVESADYIYSNKKRTKIFQIAWLNYNSKQNSNHKDKDKTGKKIKFYPINFLSRAVYLSNWLRESGYGMYTYNLFLVYNVVHGNHLSERLDLFNHTSCFRFSGRLLRRSWSTGSSRFVATVFRW